MPLDIKVRGIRSPVPTGHILGRVSLGAGDVELINIQTLATQIFTAGISAPPAGSGSAPNGVLPLVNGDTGPPGLNAIGDELGQFIGVPL